MKYRIFLNILLTSLAGLILFAVIVVGINYYLNLQYGWNNLAGKAYYISVAMKNAGPNYLTIIRGYTGQITLVDTDGVVVFDDHEQLEKTENNTSLPEIQQAFKYGTGKSIRTSNIPTQQTLYYALHLEDGKVLRLSENKASILGQTIKIIPWLFVVAVFLAITSAFVARRQTDAIITPINTLNLDEPFITDTYNELSPLIRRIGEQKAIIQNQIKDLNEKQQDFELITLNMEEGLVLVNPNGIVLSINNSAKEILNVKDNQPVGKHILALNRNIALENAIDLSVKGQRVNKILDFHGKKYQLTASPSLEGKAKNGAVILLLDVTDRILAEQQRREFSANVSHELKTPLTSISGYAELIQTGMARPDDIQNFAGLIRDEATRLIALVEDIIKLSRLDEKSGELDWVPVNLLELANQVKIDLSVKAARKNIVINVDGKGIVVEGVISILTEAIYNLVDNSIRYSEKGPILITLTEDLRSGYIIVKDSGIGIPKEEKERIFERFYRVDKSHSKDSGGTGLGLAIVKRGVLYHNGVVAVESEPGKGSTFIISIPKQA